MQKIILATLFLTISFQLFSQFELPKVEVNKVELLKSSDQIVSRKYFSNDKLIYEMNYPDKGKIKMFCRKNYGPFDSLAIFYHPRMMEIRFLNDGRIWERSWELGADVITMKMFHANKNLFKVYTEKRVEKSEDPIACVSVTSFGEYTEYDPSGQLVIYKNYDTGKIKPIKKELKAKRKKIKALLKKSNEIVINSYGKKFFNKHIKINYGAINAYDRNSYASRSSNGLPDVRSNNGWFTLPKDEITYVDFQYNINLEGKDYPLISVRVNASGKLVELFAGNRYRRKPFTKGLLSRPVTSSILSKSEVLKRNKLTEEGKELMITLTWQLENDSSVFGNLVYEVLTTIVRADFDEKIW